MMMRRLHKADAAPVFFIDRVGVPKDDGCYWTVDHYCGGEHVLTLVMRSERFYESLGKVLKTVLPGFSDQRTH